MKKVIIFLGILLILCGCSMYRSTPEKIKSERSEFYTLQQKDLNFPRKTKFDKEK